MNNLSLDTIAKTHSNNILSNALNHNATVVEFASTVIAGGEITSKRQYKKILDGYKKIHDHHNAEHIKILESFEKAVQNVGD